MGLEGEKISESPDDFKILKPEFAERESAKPFLVKTNDIFAAALLHHDHIFDYEPFFFQI